MPDLAQCFHHGHEVGVQAKPSTRNPRIENGPEGEAGWDPLDQVSTPQQTVDMRCCISAGVAELGFKRLKSTGRTLMRDLGGFLEVSWGLLSYVGNI